MRRKFDGMDNNLQHEKIDMVYLWCDGNDPEFMKRKNYYLELENKQCQDNEEAVGCKRFFDNEELKYSLRSLEMYAPWINHVYIVTDRQVPKWLNTDYEKVTIVDHSEIMPKEIIPCFNSDVLEYFLPFIPNLSEKFLYGNDDTFFGRSVIPEDFFIGDRPIVRVKKIKREELLKARSDDQYSYNATILNSLELLEARYSIKVSYEQHHNIDAYCKPAYISALKRYENYMKKYINNRFREKEDLQRILISLDMVYSGNSELKVVSNPNLFQKIRCVFGGVVWESMYLSDDDRKFSRKIQKYRPKLFCINAGTNTSIERKLENKTFMDVLFPKSSKFEK